MRFRPVQTRDFILANLILELAFYLIDRMKGRTKNISKVWVEEKRTF